MRYNFENLVGNVEKTTCEIGMLVTSMGEPAWELSHTEMQGSRWVESCCLLPISLCISEFSATGTIHCSVFIYSCFLCLQCSVHIFTFLRQNGPFPVLIHTSIFSYSECSPNYPPLFIVSFFFLYLHPLPANDLPFCFGDGFLCCVEIFLGWCGSVLFLFPLWALQF